LKGRNMDLSALPNNNHPDKFLQLDVKSLAKTSVFLQTWLANFPDTHFPGQQQWHNRVYSQVIGIDHKGHRVQPPAKQETPSENPLYRDVFPDDSWKEGKKYPSWTVQDYDRHSLNSSLAHYLKENPNDLQYWLEDIYTPGYDTLLKKKERERKHSRCCLIALLLTLLVCVIITTVTVCVLFT
uniref:Membrane integral NOTCH2 associated receptor 2 n=1 Tax=Podarcis muralis TaxID=64176 RepID=A0A670KGQ9_PODMU